MKKISDILNPPLPPLPSDASNYHGDDFLEPMVLEILGSASKMGNGLSEDDILQQIRVQSIFALPRAVGEVAKHFSKDSIGEFVGLYAMIAAGLVGFHTADFVMQTSMLSSLLGKLIRKGQIQSHDDRDGVTYYWMK